MYKSLHSIHHSITCKAFVRRGGHSDLSPVAVRWCYHSNRMVIIPVSVFLNYVFFCYSFFFLFSHYFDLFRGDAMTLVLTYMVTDWNLAFVQRYYSSSYKEFNIPFWKNTLDGLWISSLQCNACWQWRIFFSCNLISSNVVGFEVSIGGLTHIVRRQMCLNKTYPYSHLLS